MRSPFDRIARPYVFLEKICFGNALQRARTHCLSYTKSQQHALILGDGDGRFSNALLQSNRTIKVTSIDSSEAMLKLSKARSFANLDQLELMHCNALEYEYPPNHYDLICLHFFLDCFAQQQIDPLIEKLTQSLKPNGIIAYSDFTATNWLHRMLVSILYLAFRASTKIPAKQLPAINWPSSFKKLTSHKERGGFITSEIWQRTN